MGATRPSKFQIPNQNVRMKHTPKVDGGQCCVDSQRIANRSRSFGSDAVRCKTRNHHSNGRCVMEGESHFTTPSQLLSCHTNPQILNSSIVFWGREPMQRLAAPHTRAAQVQCKCNRRLHTPTTKQKSTPQFNGTANGVAGRWEVEDCCFIFTFSQ